MKNKEFKLEKTKKEQNRRRFLRRRAELSSDLRKGWILRGLSWFFLIVVTIIFGLGVTYFFGQVRTNVGESMESTLKDEDKVLVNTLKYRLKNPKRGDIIAFKPNGNVNSYSYIRRVIGLPGEKLQIKDGAVYINGNALNEDDKFPVMQYEGTAGEEITIGDDEVFVLGDNRNGSEDSRYAYIGNIKLKEIEGQVWFVRSPKERFGRIKKITME